MMKKKNLKWAMPMMTACLLAACSNDENAVETLQTKAITFGVTVNQASAPTTRNAEWEYEDTYTTGKALALKWNETNDITLFPYNSTTWMATQKGTLAVGSNNSKTVTFTAGDDIKALTALFPYKDVSLTNGATEIEMSHAFTQTGKDATHLTDYMYMYGYVMNPTATGSTMQLNHIPAVLRSLVINSGNAERIIQKVTIEASNSFCQKMKVAFTYNGSKFDTAVTPVDNASYSNIEVSCTAASDPAWNKLTTSTNATENSDRLMAYALCFPTTTAQTYTFKVTATDADGSNETTYTSNVIESSRLTTNGALKSGYYYTFQLLLDDKLTASLAKVTAMPGWGDDTEL